MYLTLKPIVLQELLGPIDPASGAQAVFVGIVRNHHQGKAVTELFYEAFQEMAEQQLTRIAQSVQHPEISAVRLLHRIGRLQVGEIALAVVVESAHRKQAFDACQNIVEEIKRQVPIWKKEFYTDGTTEWTGPCAHPKTN